MTTADEERKELASDPGRSDAVGVRFYAPAEVARRLSIGKRTFFRLLSEGRFPQPDIRLSAKLPRWSSETLEKWVLENTLKSGRF